MLIDPKLAEEYDEIMRQVLEEMEHGHELAHCWTHFWILEEQEPKPTRL